jgi:hypothetical protein
MYGDFAPATMDQCIVNHLMTGAICFGFWLLVFGFGSVVDQFTGAYRQPTA